MARQAAVVLENGDLKVEVNERDLAVRVTVKSTGETLRMAGAQRDDVLLNTPGGGEWRSFARQVESVRKVNSLAVKALLPELGLGVTIRLEDADVVFEV